MGEDVKVGSKTSVFLASSQQVEEITGKFYVNKFKGLIPKEG
jgi:hypothetical protein